ncbi:MAG: N-acetylneuraminate synthase family protein [Deltaproteobacteria bacterium]|nr:N-acetylneuraminate synthase family protein [Deltaproteobacteria bacterium]
MTASKTDLNFNTDRVYVIAEIGMNHDGSLGLAQQLTIEAAKAGANIIKYQWHIPDAETLPDAPAPHYFKGETRYNYFKRTAFSVEQFDALFALCHKLNVLSCVSLFSDESLALMLKTGADVIKIPSGEVTNVPLLRSVAKTAYPVILSSGMSDWQELDRAVEILNRPDKLCLLQCSSIYPCPPENVGLNLIKEMRQRYGVPVGLSDHTLTSATALAAVVYGAKVIEKHFTISKKLYGPDAGFSLDPEEFKKMADDIDYVVRALSSEIDKNDLSNYGDMRNVFQKSIVIKGPVSKGEVLTINNLTFKKPGTGISASKIDEVLGKRINKNLQDNTLLDWSDINI